MKKDTTPAASTAEILSSAESEREEKELKLEQVDREKIDSILLSSEMSKGGKIRVSRKGPLDQIHQYVTTIPADQWDTENTIEHLKKMYGGGDYKCQTFRANGAMYKPFEFSIDYRFKGQLDEADIRKLAGDKSNGSSDMFRIFELMNSKKEESPFKMTDLLAVMEKSSGRAEQSTMMMMTMMMKSMEVSQQNMMAMMTAIVPAMMNNKSGDTGMSSLVQELIKQRAEHTPMKETLEMMATIKEIFEPKNEEEKDDMFSRLSKLAGPVIAGLTRGAPPQVEAPPAPAQLPPDQQPAQATQPRLGGLYAFMPIHYRMMFDMAINSARRGSDPALYADLVIDQLDPQNLEILKQHLTPPDWCAKLFGDESALADVRPWLDELRRMLLEFKYGTETDGNAGNPDGSPVSTGSPQA